MDHSARDPQYACHVGHAQTVVALLAPTTPLCTALLATLVAPRSSVHVHHRAPSTSIIGTYPFRTFLVSPPVAQAYHGVSIALDCFLDPKMAIYLTTSMYICFGVLD